MSGTTPPEVDPLDFNQIFSGLQQDQHNKRQNSNGSSFGGYYDHATPDQGQGQVQRHRSGSNLSQGYQQSSEESRQNSFPLEQSTLIATGMLMQLEGDYRAPIYISVRRAVLQRSWDMGMQVEQDNRNTYTPPTRSSST
jgi:hypothetical protein